MKFKCFLILLILYSSILCLNDKENTIFIFDNENLLSYDVSKNIQYVLREILGKTDFKITVYLCSEDNIEEIFVESNEVEYFNYLKVFVVDSLEDPDINIIGNGDPVFSDTKIKELSDLVVPYVQDKKFDSALNILVLSMSKVMENHYKLKFKSTNLLHKVNPIQNNYLTVIFLVLFITFFGIILKQEFQHIFRKIDRKMRGSKIKYPSNINGFEGFSKFGGDFSRRKWRD